MAWSISVPKVLPLQLVHRWMTTTRGGGPGRAARMEMPAKMLRLTLESNVTCQPGRAAWIWGCAPRMTESLNTKTVADPAPRAAGTVEVVPWLGKVVTVARGAPVVPWPPGWA